MPALEATYQNAVTDVELLEVKLSPMAAGSKNGAVWSEGATGPIMTHFKATLATVNPGMSDKLAKELKMVGLENNVCCVSALPPSYLEFRGRCFCY